MKNCLTYAVPKWWREGGCLVIRRARILELFGYKVTPWHPMFWVPHFAHLSCLGVITQYTATPQARAEHKSGGVWRFWLYLWHFEGQIEIMSVMGDAWLTEDDVPELS